MLHLEEGSTQHEGNFIFSGKLNGHYVMIMTEPTDEEQSEVNIYSLEIAEQPAEPKSEISFQDLREKVESAELEDEFLKVREKAEPQRHGVIAICNDGSIKVFYGAGDGSNDIEISFEEFIARFEIVEG